MGGDLRKELAAALDVVIRPVCEVQRVYNEYKKHMSGKVIQTPLPEQVYLRDDNFPYWLHLEMQDPAKPGDWIGAKSNIVVPMLDAGIFDDAAFRHDPTRGRALLYVPTLLRNPNCIHVNLRHIDCRGDGGIRGNHMYVEYYPKKKRKVAFTLFDEQTQRIILVSSFWTFKKWVRECGQTPAVYVKPGSQCQCHQ